jgi:hypothetical protein
MLLALFAEGWTVMRERRLVYALLAAPCAIAGAFGASGLLEVAQHPHPQNAQVLAALFAVPGLRAVMFAMLTALFFILPSSLRRLRPDFRMTPGRAFLTLLLLCAVSLTTDLGFLALVIPGIVVGILISQALFNALLAMRPANARNPFAVIREAFFRSAQMTKGRFMTTLGVVSFSLMVLLLPFFAAFAGMILLIGWSPRSLILTAPLLFLTFVYFECVRYVLITRLYASLARNE